MIVNYLNLSNNKLLKNNTVTLEWLMTMYQKIKIKSINSLLLTK